MRFRPERNWLGLLIPGCLAAWGAHKLWHLWSTDLMLAPAILTLYAVLAGIKLFFTFLFMIPRIIRHARARRVTGKGGTAGWASPKEIRKAGLHKKARGFFAALTLSGKALLLHIESSGMLLSSAGGGKTISFILPALAHNDMCMIVADLKSTLAPMTKKLREEKHGHKAYCLNPAKRYTDTVGAPACYNPLQIVIDNWLNPAHHGRVLTDAKAIALQLYPEPVNTTDNRFFRNGSRKLIVFAIVYQVVMGLDATLTGVFTLLQSRRRFTDAVEVALSTDYLNGDLAGLAEDLETKLQKADPRQVESFFEGALGELEIYSSSGPLAESTSRCDFRFHELRDEKATVYIMSDPTWQEAFNRWTGLIYWCAKTELMRKAEGEKVCFLIDEATNVRIEGLPSLLTLAREFNITIWLVLQELEEWAALYGRPSVETLLSQTEAKIFYGIRSQRACQLVSEMLGERSIVSQGHNIGVDIFDPVSRSLSEGSRRLMTPDEVRRTDDAIIFVRGMRPIRGERIGYHQVKPWSNPDWVAINPLFGKPYKGKTKLHLRYRQH